MFGQGEGKMGIALRLNNGLSSSTNARIANSNLRLTNGFIQIKELELDVEGRDSRGEFEKEIEIDFDDIKKVTFDEFDRSVDFFINIPEGEYKEIEFEMDLIEYRNEPSIFIEGVYSKEGTEIPVRFQYFGDEIDFKVEIESDDDDNYFKIDRMNNPLALFEINALNWFSQITDAEFNNAEITEGVIVISRQSNKALYDKVKGKLEASADIEIELD
ncbi:hypothetical protein C943_01079 [Mariniradius saccharolyticus AK6]|uniref:DUF4382 domain-containing protein n=2 Tax=Mariniradius TaxID=1245590 RepID=M7XV53_9BACT|nr:hypothetical protein C943_01079 [Mariniradius saccharolyticus AK6]